MSTENAFNTTSRRLPRGSDVVPCLEIELIDSKFCLACMPHIAIIKNGCWDRHTKRHRLDVQKTCPFPGCGYMSVRLEILENHQRSKHQEPLLRCPLILSDPANPGSTVRCPFETATMQTMRHHTSHEHGVALSSICTFEPPEHPLGTRRLMEIDRSSESLRMTLEQEFTPSPVVALHPSTALHPSNEPEVKGEREPEATPFADSRGTPLRSGNPIDLNIDSSPEPEPATYLSRAMLTPRAYKRIQFQSFRTVSAPSRLPPPSMSNAFALPPRRYETVTHVPPVNSNAVASLPSFSRRRRSISVESEDEEPSF